MTTLHAESFALDNFEGPLDFLLHLIRKHEIDIYDVPIQRITQQFLERVHDIDKGADFIGLAATLLWMKSRMLLPKEEGDEEFELDEDPCFEIIHKLVAYCRFKEIAKNLQVMEEEQCSFFPRGTVAPSGTIIEPSIGIEHLSLDDLAKILERALDNAAVKRGMIREEEWRVSDKITLIKGLIEDAPRCRLDRLFTSDHGHVEMIVTFLAILELMKGGIIQVVWDTTRTYALIMKGEPDEERSEPAE